MRMLFIIYVSLYSMCLGAQDAHFSGIGNTNYLDNPATSGFFDGDLRIRSTFRNQWGGSFDNPYQTAAGAIDYRLNTNKQCDYFGVGLGIVSDHLGAASLHRNGLILNTAYFKTLDNKKMHHLAVGLGFGINNWNLNYNPNEDFIDEPEQLEQSSQMNLDLSAGLLWYAYLNKKHFYYAGLGANHLNRADLSFYNTTADIFGGDVAQFRRYELQAGGQFRLTREFSVIPAFSYHIQGPAREVTFGGFYKYHFFTAEKKKETALAGGIFYRTFDAIIVAIRGDYNNYFLSINYDINSSRLNAATNTYGGIELSLGYIFDRGKNRCNDMIKYCPVF